MDYYKIGQRIRKFRKAHGLSQEELSEQINISTTHMSHIETGNTKLSLPVLVDIAAKLEVHTDDLLTDSTDVSVSKSAEEILSLLDGCTARQARVIVDVVKTTKSAMEKYL